MKSRVCFKFTVFLIITVMVLGVCPYVFAADNNVENDMVIEHTPQIVNDVFRYLNDIYIEKYPEEGLTPDFGSSKDKAELKNLADAISYGCKTDREKADAVYYWIRRNIEYSEFEFAYPIDVYKARAGDCTGVAYLMQDLLRLMGIPAVASSGWTQNMAAITIGELFKKDALNCYVYAGHAWDFVYLDGEWVLYDTLWGRQGVGDRDFIAENFYITNVGRVTPAYNYPQMQYNYVSTIYTGEGFYNVNTDNGEIYTDGTHPFQILNMHMIFGTQYYFKDGNPDRWYAVKPSGVNEKLTVGKNHSSGWYYRIYEPGGYVGVLESTYKAYIYFNNTSISMPNQILTMGDRVFYQNGGEATDITPYTGEYTTRYGRLSVPVGYSGGLIDSEFTHVYSREYYDFKWTSSDESVLRVDEYGNIEAVGVGFAEIDLVVSRKAMGALPEAVLGGEFIQLYVYDRNDVTNTSDNGEATHSHEYTRITRDATCDIGGAVIDVCNHPNCGDYNVISQTPALGHSFGEYVINKDATNTIDGTKTAICTVCNKKDTVCDENSRGSILDDDIEDKGILKTDKGEMEQYAQNLSQGDSAEIKALNHSGIELDVSVLEEIRDKNCTLDLTIGDIHAYIFPETLSGILNNAQGENITFHIKGVGISALNEKQLAAIENAETSMIISAEIYCGENYIHTFGDNNNIELRFPFFNASAQNSSEYKVYYLDEDGNITPVWCMWEDYEGGVMSFTTDHFSTYIIAKGVKEESPTNDNIIPIICSVCGGVVVIVGIIVIIKIKKKKK